MYSSYHMAENTISNATNNNNNNNSNIVILSQKSEKKITTLDNRPH